MKAAPFRIMLPGLLQFGDLFFSVRPLSAKSKPVPARAPGSSYSDVLRIRGGTLLRSFRARPLLRLVGILNRALTIRPGSVVEFRLVERPEGLLVTAGVTGDSLIAWVALLDPRSLPEV